MLENDTRNQHFLPRVEQKLNALNPQAADRNLRIYSFRLVDRESYSLVLESPNGRPIGSNLSMFGLFSFDVLGDSQRLNFESLFQKYETNIETHTKGLLTKLNARSRDIKAEVIDLFAAKLLNFVRNPFSIIKVLNTFPGLVSYEPANPALLADYRRVVSGKKPHQAHLCARLGISDRQYLEWLRVLFMLLMQMGEGQPNLFEAGIKTLLEDRKKHVAAFVCEYDQDRCLLSDRGYSQPIQDGEHMAFSFNLCSTAFIHYLFADPGKLVQGRASPEFLAHVLASWERRPQVQLDVTHIRNDRALLACYNRHVVEQCHERVYCSAKGRLVLSDPSLAAEPAAWCPPA
jgi:hypothetical protein